jgi:hypothetical protein
MKGWKCRMMFEVEGSKVDDILGLLEQYKDQITDFRMQETDQLTKTYYKKLPTALTPYKKDGYKKDEPI